MKLTQGTWVISGNGSQELNKLVLRIVTAHAESLGGSIHVIRDGLRPRWPHVYELEGVVELPKARQQQMFTFLADLNSLMKRGFVVQIKEVS